MGGEKVVLRDLDILMQSEKCSYGRNCTGKFEQWEVVVYREKLVRLWTESC